MKKLLLIALATLVSCAKDNSITRSWWIGLNYNNYVINIDSEPQGAYIEFDNAYIGKTPCKLVVNCNSCGYAPIEVVATMNGYYQQRKELRGYMPRNVMFFMNLQPTNNDYNININK